MRSHVTVLLKSWKSLGRVGGSLLQGTESLLAWSPALVPMANPCPCCARSAGPGAHPLLSDCSNLGRSWTWRSFSTSGAPRWVLPAASAAMVSLGRVLAPAPALPSSLAPWDPGTGYPPWGDPPQAAQSPCPVPAGGAACMLHPKPRREGRALLTLPPLCVDVSVVSSLLSVPPSQTLFPAHG